MRIPIFSLSRAHQLSLFLLSLFVVSYHLCDCSACVQRDVLKKSDLRPLAADIAKIPPVAFNCTLAGLKVCSGFGLDWMMITMMCLYRFGLGCAI